MIPTSKSKGIFVLEIVGIFPQEKFLIALKKIVVIRMFDCISKVQLNNK